MPARHSAAYPPRCDSRVRIRVPPEVWSEGKNRRSQLGRQWPAACRCLPARPYGRLLTWAPARRRWTSRLWTLSMDESLPPFTRARSVWIYVISRGGWCGAHDCNPDHIAICQNLCVKSRYVTSQLRPCLGSKPFFAELPSNNLGRKPVLSNLLRTRSQSARRHIAHQNPQMTSYSTVPPLAPFCNLDAMLRLTHFQRVWVSTRVCCEHVCRWTFSLRATSCCRETVPCALRYGGLGWIRCGL